MMKEISNFNVLIPQKVITKSKKKYWYCSDHVIKNFKKGKNSGWVVVFLKKMPIMELMVTVKYDELILLWFQKKSGTIYPHNLKNWLHN